MKLTKRQALFIKIMRVKRSYSWRAVHREFITRYTFKQPFGTNLHRTGNQIDGMSLCVSAMNKLKEKQEDGWN